ncbi:hypothetical protein chiPu_0022101, partial [Chiloscyllium punctatum]|nr:hypothetical protein [Chiloscyllium punctatum]
MRCSNFGTVSHSCWIYRSVPFSKRDFRNSTFLHYLCHVCIRNDSLAGVVIADSEYPSRVCFSLLDKVLEEFSRQVDSNEWPSGSPNVIRYTGLDAHLARYQNPREADAMCKVQAELDETKVIL